MLTLEQRLRKLEDIVSSNEPVVFCEELFIAHERRVRNAGIYINELDEVTLQEKAKQVKLSTFNKEVENADVSSIEFDGQFCKLALIQNWGNADRWVLYLAPLSKI